MWFVPPNRPSANLPPLTVLTIVKDGLPWIAQHYQELKRSGLDWQWHVVEGTAAPEACTAWCASQPPGLSTDGTTEYLNTLVASDTRIVLHRSELWHGKISMVNEPLKYIWQPCVLLQADADEMWTADQLRSIVQMFQDNPERNAAYFMCRYFLGPDVIISTRGGFGNHLDYEWLRAWRFNPGMRFKTHEPPSMDGQPPNAIMHDQTEALGLVFDHMAFATEAQVLAKVKYYGSAANKVGHLYATALEGWHRLQDNQTWPATVRDFLPFVRDDSMAVRINR